MEKPTSTRPGLCSCDLAAVPSSCVIVGSIRPRRERFRHPRCTALPAACATRPRPPTRDGRALRRHVREMAPTRFVLYVSDAQRTNRTAKGRDRVRSVIQGMGSMANQDGTWKAKIDGKHQAQNNEHSNRMDVGIHESQVGSIVKGNAFRR